MFSRKPPRLPDHRAGCVWCGGALTGRRRSWCSDACVAEYRIANFAADAQRHVWDRDAGVCARCGSTPDSRRRWQTNRATWTQSRYVAQWHWPPGWDGMARLTWVHLHDPGWAADHIIPLWSVDRSAPDAFRFWTMANLQTLCLPCHAAKTAREAADRAAIRRGAARAKPPTR
jgi:5-methylcytosine-specific restriction enzyme A